MPRYYILAALILAVSAYGEDITDIRQKYNYINERIEQFDRSRYSSDKVGITNAEKTGLGIHSAIITVYKQEKYTKIVAFLDSRYEEITLEYYYFDDWLFFMFEQEKEFLGVKGREIDGVPFDENKYNLYENRFYFKDNKMIRWLSESKQNIPSDSFEFILKEATVIKDSQIYLTLCPQECEEL